MHHPKCVLARGNEVAPDLAHPPSYLDMAGWVAGSIWNGMVGVATITGQLLHQTAGDRLTPPILREHFITGGIEKAAGVVRSARNAAATILHH